MIVDAHTHIAESGRHGSRDASADALVREMDAAGVDVAIVLPLPGMASNEFVVRETARFPSRLVPLYCPEFQIPRDTVGKLERAASERRLHGLKIHPRVQQVTVADPVVRDVLAWASEHRVPVVFDAFPWGPTVDDSRMHPFAYHQIAGLLPELRLILAHAGGYKVLEAFLVAKANPNVVLDLSFTFTYFRGASVAADLAYVISRLPAAQTMYGSDFPDVSFAEYLQVAREHTARLDAARSRSLFAETARAVFGLV